MIHAAWAVLAELAPWVLAGMVIAGLLHALLPRDFVRRQLTGKWSVLKAVAIGVPLPLCSCGVIPVAVGLKRDGASDGAAVGFLIATPQTGVDSILVSGWFLGWPFALFKVLTATVTGVVGGLFTNATGTGFSLSPSPYPIADETGSSLSPSGSRLSPTSFGLDILRSIWVWIVVGVVCSAAIEAFVPDSFFTKFNELGTFVPMLAALVVGLPLYVCATSSVPIAAALVARGMSPGAALVFLIAGPASNVATIGAVYRTFGSRVLAIYLSTIVAGSLLAGWLFDSLLTARATDVVHVHGGPRWWQQVAAVVLLLLMTRFAYEDFRAWLARRRRPADAPHGCPDC